jgi:hypothetical protein
VAGPNSSVHGSSGDGASGGFHSAMVGVTHHTISDGRAAGGVCAPRLECPTETVFLRVLVALTAIEYDDFTRPRRVAFTTAVAAEMVVEKEAVRLVRVKLILKEWGAARRLGEVGGGGEQGEGGRGGGGAGGTLALGTLSTQLPVLCPGRPKHCKGG